MDANFLHEVFIDQGTWYECYSLSATLHLSFPFPDEYFVSNIEKVDSVTLLRKDKIMAGISWSVKFQKAVDTWPCINDLGSSAAQVQN